MIPFVVSRLARRDIAEVLRQSQARFGLPMAERYESLIFRSILDVSRAPERATPIALEGLSRDLSRFHLRLARTPNGDVRRPRHLLVVHIAPQRLTVVRLLHERMDLGRHLS